MELRRINLRSASKCQELLKEHPISTAVSENPEIPAASPGLTGGYQEELAPLGFQVLFIAQTISGSNAEASNDRQAPRNMREQGRVPGFEPAPPLPDSCMFAGNEVRLLRLSRTPAALGVLAVLTTEKESLFSDNH